jgi:hypothetical protein
MTWFGIDKPSETSQWVLTTAPIGINSAYITTTTPTSVGPLGGSVTGTITTSAVSLYQQGSTTETPVTNETFPSPVNKRSNIVWGIQSYGIGSTNLYFDFSSIGGVSFPGTYLIRRVPGGNWEIVIEVVSTTYTLTGVTGSYEYALGGNPDSPLPIQLASFSSNVNGNSVTLNWLTSNELSNKGFEIQRMNNSEQIWKSTGFINGKGNPNTVTYYKYTDTKINPGIYEYRLKQIDLNNNYQFYNLNSDVRVSNPNKNVLYQNYPNPANPKSKIEFEISSNAIVKIDIFDVTGKLVNTLINERKTPGTYDVSFNGNNLASGIYYYKLIVNNETDIFVAVKKLVLIK